jgi:hypothetical protein
MAYQPHVLVAWGGPMGSSGEIWGNTLRCGGYADYDETSLQAACDGWLGSLISSYISASASNFTTEVQLEYVKANRVGPDGKYVDPTTAVHFYDTMPHGSAGSITWPYQVSMVASLRTAVKRGAGTHGRLYLPSQAWTMSSNGEVSDTVTDSVASGVNGLLQSMIDNANPLPVYVYSRSGPFNQVTDVLCGSVPDTQRRRRNALVETYVDYPLTI